MFELSAAEFVDLKSQIATSSDDDLANAEATRVSLPRRAEATGMSLPREGGRNGRMPVVSVSRLF